ncbi:MAG: hypothetical protein WDZ49_16235 [Litorilinea sp.]
MSRDASADAASRRDIARASVRWFERMLIVGIVLWAAWIQTASAIPAHEARLRTFALAAAGLGFDLVEWEVTSLRAKARAFIAQPAAGLSEADATSLVREYMARAVTLGHLERELEARISQPDVAAEENSAVADLRAEIDALRTLQGAERPTVEAILEQQVTWALQEAGLGVGARILPPVKFAFTEPPRKVIVSPRDRIAMEYTRMVEAGLPLDTLESIESRIGAQTNAVGYVSNIGGLGAYPSMVVDRATLSWVISTIAHEWVHNYLTFFPLGLFYFGSGDLTTMNETVADIVGEEIGLLVLERYYPDLVPPEALVETTQAPESDRGAAEGVPAVFDFRAEMRTTRLEVDRLLAAGLIEEAEAYMEMRRQLFVENGYIIRVLNQAYFAFHGSYATSPASVSPIGPKMAALRAAAADLPGFLHTVRWFTAQADLDQALIDRDVVLPAGS